MLVHPPEICPSCGAAMRLGRRVPAYLNQPELQNFECRPCGIIVTQAAPAAPAASRTPLLARA